MSEQDRDQRTEAPTPQRLRKAMEEGQVGMSAELIGSTVLLAGTLYFWFAGAWFFSEVAETMRYRVTYFEDSILAPSSAIQKFVTQDVARLGAATVAMLLPILVIAAVSGLLQTQFNISFKPLTPKPEKLDVAKGFKKIFSVASLMRGFMAISKATVIIAIIIFLALSYRDEIVNAANLTTAQFLVTMCRIILMIAVAVAGTIGTAGNC